MDKPERLQYKSNQEFGVHSIGKLYPPGYDGVTTSEDVASRRSQYFPPAPSDGFRFGTVVMGYSEEEPNSFATYNSLLSKRGVLDQANLDQYQWGRFY